MMMDDIKFYGSTTVGEKGQVVLSAKLRRELGIATGEKLMVLVINKMAISGIAMVKAKDLTSIIERIFGANLSQLSQLIETKEDKQKPIRRQKPGTPADK